MWKFEKINLPICFLITYFASSVIPVYGFWCSCCVVLLLFEFEIVFRFWQLNAIKIQILECVYSVHLEVYFARKYVSLKFCDPNLPPDSASILITRINFQGYDTSRNWGDAHFRASSSENFTSPVFNVIFFSQIQNLWYPVALCNVN